MSKIQHIKLYFSELFFDARNKTYLAARGAEMSHKQEAYAQLTEDESEKEQFRRSLSTAMAECVEALYPYTKMAVQDNVETTDKLKEDIVYDITLSLPDGMSETTITLVTNLLHDYLVYRTLSDWYNLIGQGSSDSWLLRADASLEQIRIRMNARINRIRRTQTPF